MEVQLLALDTILSDTIQTDLIQGKPENNCLDLATDYRLEPQGRDILYMESTGRGGSVELCTSYWIVLRAAQVAWLWIYQ